MKLLFKLFLALGFLIGSITTVFAQSKNFKDWDILGVKIGNTSEEAIAALRSGIQDVIFDKKDGFLRKGSFVLPSLSFGLNAYARSASFDSSSDRVHLVYDLNSKNTVIAISRGLSFRGNNNMPSVASVLQALTEKYGKPDFNDGNEGNWYKYYWTHGISDKLNNKKGVVECGDNISYAFYDYGVDERIDKACGVLLSARIDVDFSNKNLAGFVFVELVDTIKARNSYEHIAKVMEDGDQAKKAKEVEQGDRVKPKF